MHCMEKEMKHELLSQLVTESGTELDQLKKHKKGLETALVRVQPLLNKYLTEGHDSSDCSFKVCMLGPSCKRRGGAELFAELEKLTAPYPQAEVVESQCLARCGRGPNVELGGIVYTSMNASRAAELVESQLGKKRLNVDLLVDDEFASEAVVAENKRCLLDDEVRKVIGLKASLQAQIEAVSANLPADHNRRVSAQVLLMQAMKLHEAISLELAEAEELLKRVVPLDAFVDKIFARELAGWRSRN